MKKLLPFLFGVVFGLIPGVTITFGWYDGLIQDFVFGMKVVLGSLITLTFIAAATYLFRDKLTEWLFGEVRTAPENIIGHAIDAVEAAANNNRQKAVVDARVAFEEVFSWWIWAQGIRWLLGIILGFVATFAAGLGTYLLFLQNDILGKQTDALIEAQRQSDERGREGLLLETVDLIANLTSQSSDATIRARLEILLSGESVLRSRPLSSEMMELSQSLQTNERSNGGSLQCLRDQIDDKTDIIRTVLAAGFPISDLPIQSLNGIDLSGLSLVDSRIDRRIDWNGVIAERAKLEKVDFSQLDSLNSASFQFSGMDEVSFEGVALQQICFRNVMAPRTSFAGGLKDGLDFTGAYLEGASFSGGPLVDATFESSWLYGARFGRQRLSNVDFTESILAFSKFGGENTAIRLFNVDFTGANLSGANFSWVEEIDEFSRSSMLRGCVQADWHPCGPDGEIIRLPACLGNEADPGGRSIPIPTYEEVVAMCKSSK